MYRITMDTAGSLPGNSARVPEKPEVSFQEILEQVRQAGDDKKLKEACEGLEAALWHQVLKAMRATIPDSGFLGGGLAKDVYESMLDEKYAELAAGSSKTGLAEMLYQELKQR